MQRPSKQNLIMTEDSKGSVKTQRKSRSWITTEAIDRHGLEQPVVIDRLQRDAIRPAVQPPIEAGPAAGVAGGTTSFDLDSEKQCVLVAVGKNVEHTLRLARCFAFAPEAIARPAPIVGEARGEGLFEGGLVHPGGHQALPGVGIDNEDRDEPAVIEARRECAALFDRSLVCQIRPPGG